MLPDVPFFRKFGCFLIWLPGKSFVWWVADFLNISEIFWRIFVQDLDQCLLHKKDVKSLLEDLDCLFHFLRVADFEN